MFASRPKISGCSAHSRLAEQAPCDENTGKERHDRYLDPSIAETAMRPRLVRPRGFLLAYLRNSFGGRRSARGFFVGAERRCRRVSRWHLVTGAPAVDICAQPGGVLR